MTIQAQPKRRIFLFVFVFTIYLILISFFDPVTFVNAEDTNPFTGIATVRDEVIFTETGNLNNPRAYHTATILNNGKVLVAGGYLIGVDRLASAELYDPATGTWTITGNMSTARQFHTATLLSNGKVLVAGGRNDGYLAYLSSAELYDPASGTWAITGNMNFGRVLHTVTLLNNGKVLEAGGSDEGNNTLTSAELGTVVSFFDIYLPIITK